MDKLWDLANTCLPFFIALVIGFGIWVTKEVYAAKYTALTQEDGRRMKAEAVASISPKLDLVLEEVKLLRQKVDELQESQAETLVEIRYLKENR